MNKHFIKMTKESWVDEIKPPQKIFTLGFITYILAVIATFLKFFFETPDIKAFILITLTIVIAYAAFDILKILKNAFFTKVKPETDTEIPEMI